MFCKLKCIADEDCRVESATLMEFHWIVVDASDLPHKHEGMLLKLGDSDAGKFESPWG